MIEQTRTALKQLQDMDSGIAAKREQITALGEAALDVEAPVEALESEVSTTRSRLQEMRLEERRVELLVRDRESRIEKLDERLQGVRNVREESAVRSEIDMVRQVLASTEQEALSLVDQIRRLETRLAEQEAALAEARSQVEPRRVELQAERSAAEGELASLESARTTFAGTLPKAEVALYERIRQGGQRRAVAVLTGDGACGHCFGVLPLQMQNEVREGTSLVRCEFCGVILATAGADEPEPGAPVAGDSAPAPVTAAEDAAASDEAEPAEETEETA